MFPESRNIVIYGAGGHAKSVANVALAAGYTILGFVDAGKQGGVLCGAKIVAALDDLFLFEKFFLAIAVGDNFLREKIHASLSNAFSKDHFPALVHPSATVSIGVELGYGCVVMPGAVIGPSTKIGAFCLVNTKASIDHDCLMMDFSSLAPGVTVGGAVTIGVSSAICIGASVRHSIQVGNNSILGAHAYLNNSLPDQTVAYGVPAIPVKIREIGDIYL